ncbi:23S rRNA-/tRNA-specific pseudouridylate synthase [Luteococcus japonicus]|uniref:RNA pseudouridylate synthase n=2 Tax=Propionibacteriaceae TaxID=31957 RepID=A0A3N1ZV37_9ACTN|nr:23S rRNA-/tRNA-specific pseudouridylate synthase [Luteococcus japonicus]
MPRSPLPVRHGLNAAWVGTPREENWATMRDFLVWKIPRLTPERIDEMFAEERFVDEKGTVLPLDAPYKHHSFIFFHRDLPDETEPPGELLVLHRDERLVVLDKPHFTSTIPRGQHIIHSAVVRARRELDLPDLSPAHRLDRATAGILLCTTRREHRRAYQMMFEQRVPQKTYEAIGRLRPELDFPLDLSSHMTKTRGVMQAEEVPGRDPNAHTRIELLDRAEHPVHGPIGRYLVKPTTGKTHQIRLHMSSAGIPIVNDPFYPEVLDRSLDDFTLPLQLLAKELRFVDPVDGSERVFTSARTLSVWDEAR